jgi:lipopolysaccharide export system permease protein
MLTIDRYLLRFFVRVLLVCFISVMGLVIVIDVFANLDEFLAIAKRQGSLATLMWQYYGPRMLAFFDRTSALFALVAATFAVTSLQRANELAALMATGISKFRVVRPLVVGAVAVSLLAAINRESLIPSCRDRLMRNAQNWEGQSQKELHPRYDNRTNILLGGRNTLAAEQRILQPTFRLPRGMRAFGSQLIARDAYFQRPVQGRPGGYLLVGMEQPANLADISSVYQDQRAVILSPSDTAWLKADECFVVSDVSFEQLAAGNEWRQYSGTSELIAGLHNPSLDFGADVRVAVHARFVQPLLDITLFFLGLPLVLSRENRNIFVATGMCFLVLAGFLVVVVTCHTLGSNCLLSPALAAWGPLLIFVPLASVTAQALWQ